MLKAKMDGLLSQFGINLNANNGLETFSPIDGSFLGRLPEDNEGSIDRKVKNSVIAQKKWHDRGLDENAKFLTNFADSIEKNASALTQIMAIDGPKTPEEAALEVTGFVGTYREMIKLVLAKNITAGIADEIKFKDKTIARLKTPVPVGVGNVTTSFNFPLAVFSWSAAPMQLTGNTVIWKPSEKDSLVALAVKAIHDQNCENNNCLVLKDVLQIVIGGSEVSSGLAAHPYVKMLDATGGPKMCESLQEIWDKKREHFIKNNLGYLPEIKLEGSGNNGILISQYNSEKALEDAADALVYCALAGGGLKCTDARRAVIHESIYDNFLGKLLTRYKSFIDDGNVKNPLTGAPNKHGYAPLPDKASFDVVQKAKSEAIAQGGKLYFGERVLDELPNAFYLNPAIIEMPTQTPVMLKECFGPLLYVTKYSDLDDGIKLVLEPENAGLSNAIYSQNKQEITRFMQANGPLAGHGSANMPTGTGTPAHKMGFRGKRKSGGRSGAASLGYDGDSDVFSQYQNPYAMTRFVTNLSVALDG